MSKAINGLFRRVLIQGSLLTATIAIIGGGIGFAVAGQPGLISALIGAALALGFVSLTALSVWLGGKLPLGGFFGLVLGGWIVKLVAFILVIGALKGADFINGPVLFFTLVASILGTLAVDSLAFLKARIPVVGD
ncbi:hypothetical protein [Rhodoluna sp.]|uniref:hypothetical protein n=1 Tax=Rhodoluna sp. TaxID=1969481 RepID=UPI0025F3D936|nr:hypothetical protein [Rhodoluna sp.]